MDTRIINTRYERRTIELFVWVTQMCVADEFFENSPGVPEVLYRDSTPKMSRRLIYQNWGECPMNSGACVYWSLNENGDIELRNPEGADVDFSWKDPADIPVEYVIPWDERDEWLKKWYAGDA